MLEVREWWVDEEIHPAFVCERCGTEDAIACLGCRQLCTECRQALDLCTMCAAPTMHGEWWCPSCELSMAEYLV